MQTMRQAVAQYVKDGRGKETAYKLAFLDCCYGRVEYSWGDDEIPCVLTEVTKKCTHCNALSKHPDTNPDVAEDSAIVQRAYWTPSHFQLWHKDCHAKHYHLGVIEQQTIDMDCNECKHFEAKEQTDKAGGRRGICGRTGVATTAYPGGTFCNYPTHEQCFEHRKAHLIKG